MESGMIERSIYVRDYDYNNVGCDDENNRFNCKEELELYLDKVFIPNNVAYKRIGKNNFGEERRLSIQFNKILSLKCSENEIRYILQYLCDRDIYVGGIVSVLDGEYKNYDYKQTYKLSSFPICMSWEEQKELFDKYIMYKKTNDPKKNDIAKKIAEGSLRLIPYVTYKYALFSGIDVNEFNGYGCEGLMLAIDKFDPSLGYKFSTFAVPYIKNRVNNGLRELRGFGDERNFYSLFIKCKDAVEKGYSEDAGKYITIYDDPVMIEDIICLMRQTCNFSKKLENNIRNKINIVYHDDLYTDLIDDFNMEDKMIEEEQKKNLWDALNSIPEKERDIILKRFGFNENRIVSLEEIGKQHGVSKERVRQIEKKVISRFRDYNCLK